MTVAQRVAQELGCAPGTLVGHRVRFDDCTDVQGRGTTKIIYATDGMLLREATADPLLTRYMAVVSWEFGKLVLGSLSWFQIIIDFVIFIHYNSYLINDRF